MSFPKSKNPARIGSDIFPSEAMDLIEKHNKTGDGLVIVDVSTPSEFSNQHLENAINIDFISRSFKARLGLLDKNTTCLVYCKVGGRSKLAMGMMKKLGFKNVYNVRGGTLLWEEEGLPFATGGQPDRFSFCPVYLSIVTIRKVRKFFRDKLPIFSSVAEQ